MREEKYRKGGGIMVLYRKDRIAKEKENPGMSYMLKEK